MRLKDTNVVGVARRYAEKTVGTPGPNAGPVRRAANASQIISVVVIGVVALVGILIFGQIYEAIPMEVLEDDEGDPTQYGQSVDSLVDGFGGAMELVPIVLLVIIAALVIGVVQRMRMNR